MLTQLPVFLAAVVLMSASPGPAMALQVVEIGLYLVLAGVVGRAAGWFRRPVIRRRLDAVAGTVLIGLGARVAATGR